MSGEAIDELARFLTGMEVGYQSDNLSVGGLKAQRAKRFFKLRTAFGVSGYASEEEAKAAIIAALARARGESK